MKKILVVVDYQNDFVDGTLGFEKAKTLEDGIVNKVNKYIESQEGVIFTLDIHYEDYLNTREGKNLPIPHCMKGTDGYKIYGKLKEIQLETNIYNTAMVGKNSFGIDPFDMCNIMKKFKGIKEIEIIGIVTNMCVISNVVTFQSAFPEAQMIVDANLCASFDDEMHEKALDVMESMQVKIINREGK